MKPEARPGVCAAVSFCCFAVCIVAYSVTYWTATHEFALFDVSRAKSDVAGREMYRGTVVVDRRNEARSEVELNCNSTLISGEKNCYDHDDEDETPDECPTEEATFYCGEDYAAALMLRTDEQFQTQQTVANAVFIPLMVIFFLCFGGCSVLAVRNFSKADSSPSRGFF